MPKLKVEPYLMKHGNKVGKAAIEFDSSDGLLKNFHLVGFTICEDKEKGIFVLFPSSTVTLDAVGKRQYFFLRPTSADDLNRLEDAIIDTYENMTGINHPVLKE